MGAEESKPGGDGPAVQELAADTLFFMGSKGETKGETKPYIIAKRSSPFVQFCLLAESLIKTRDRIVRTYTPKRAPEHFSDDSSSSDDEVNAGSQQADTDAFDYGILDGNGRTKSPDPERGEVPPNDRMRMSDMQEATLVGGDAVETGPAELGSGIRNRTARSPTRSETWTVDLTTHMPHGSHNPLPSNPERGGRAPRPFGDVNYSTVVRMLPPAYSGTALGQPAESEQYCRIDHIELWSAYRVFVVFREEDAGLMRAVQNGAIDLTVRAHEAGRVDAITRERVNGWRAQYAEVLNTYNNTLDTFVAKAGVYFAMAASRGDAQAAALHQLAEAVGDARKTLLPHGDAGDVAGGTDGVVEGDE
jgi:hypothetical protein